MPTALAWVIAGLLATAGLPANATAETRNVLALYANVRRRFPSARTPENRPQQ
jgi:hypothetical protein